MQSNPTGDGVCVCLAVVKKPDIKNHWKADKHQRLLALTKFEDWPPSTDGSRRLWEFALGHSEAAAILAAINWLGRRGGWRGRVHSEAIAGPG